MKKILFVIESLAVGGAEKSLLSLLSNLDYTKYEVYLQLFAYEGLLQQFLPDKVNLLPRLPFFSYCKGGFFSSERRRGYLWSRVSYSLRIRRGQLDDADKAVDLWRSASRCFTVDENHYDIAIAYAQGGPTFYVADCVKAEKKYAWINVSYRPLHKNIDFIKQRYQNFDKVVCVSEKAGEIYKEVFQEEEQNIRIIRDIIDRDLIEKMSMDNSEALMEMKCNDRIKLLTVGRLNHQKGYDLAVEAADILKLHGIKFKWFVLGEGALRSEIQKKIENNQLQDYFVLLGNKANPYPYYKNADFYVHTARFEGFGIAIAEARILNVPVVTTNFDAVYMQMINEENGLVVDMNPVAIATGIERLIKEKEVYNHIAEYLKREKKGNIEEIDKFYALIEER